MSSKGKVLITGGTGLIGSHLIPMLKERGFELVVLSRTPRTIPGVEVYLWDPENNKIDSRCVMELKAVIHLAGAGIADKRWTDKRKQEILTSRVAPVRLLFQTMERASSWPEVFITASGVHLYDQDDFALRHTEDSLATDSFLANVIKAWEGALTPFALRGIRTVSLRTGLVLDNKRGALPTMVKPVRLGLGAAVGSGKQHISWIHIRDICRLYTEAIEDNTFQGAYNCVAPGCVSNSELMRLLSNRLGKPFWPIAVPGFLLKAVIGERASLILEGTCIVNKRLEEEIGFTYQFPEIGSAIDDLYR